MVPTTVTEDTSNAVEEDNSNTVTEDNSNAVIEDTTKPQPKTAYYPQHGIGFKNSMNMTCLDDFLDLERTTNQNEPWNKLDKTRKTQILHGFSETYGRENDLPLKNVKQLKMFFNACLEKGKLAKAKDVTYDRDARAIESIPSLTFNPEKKQFYLRNIDTKRVSTLKSMTPKKKNP